MWSWRAFPSGTTVVEPPEPGGPWLYVLMTNPEDIDNQRDRYLMCDQLVKYLNGGHRPVWFDDFERVSEDELKASDGASIQAVGPMFDANPPSLNWQTRMDDESKDARARLIDRVCGVNGLAIASSH